MEVYSKLGPINPPMQFTITSSRYLSRKMEGKDGTARKKRLGLKKTKKKTPIRDMTCLPSTEIGNMFSIMRSFCNFSSRRFLFYHSKSFISKISPYYSATLSVHSYQIDFYVLDSWLLQESLGENFNVLPSHAGSYLPYHISARC